MMLPDFVPFWLVVGFVSVQQDSLAALVLLVWAHIPLGLEFAAYAYLAGTGQFGVGSTTIEARSRQLSEAVVAAMLNEPEISWTVYMPSCSCPRCWALYFVNFIPVICLLWPVLWLPPFIRVVRRLTGRGG